jgi:NitT/TauT family transport system permease protein
MRRLVVTTAFFSGLALLWHLAAASGRWSPVLLPAPLDVARYLAAAAVDGSLLSAGLVTGRRLAVGYALGIALGVPFGCLTARFRGCADTLGVVALGLQTLPSVCWVPLALLWFGPTEAAVLFVVVMGTTWSIQIATDDGLRSIPPIYVRAARTMGSRGLHTVVRVLVPASLPAVVSGMKQGWAFAWRSLMAAEVFVSILTGFGLGHLLHYGRELQAMDQVIGVMLVIVAFGLVADRVLFAPAERWVRRRWGTGTST